MLECLSQTKIGLWEMPVDSMNHYKNCKNEHRLERRYKIENIPYRDVLS